MTKDLQLLSGLFLFLGWLAALSEVGWIHRTVDAWYLFLPAALLGALLSLPGSVWLARNRMPNEGIKARVTMVAMTAAGAAGFGVCLASLANRVGAPTEEFSEIHRVVRTSHAGKRYVPIVIVETARGTDFFVITEMESVIRPNERIRLVLRHGNLGFARFARVERLSGKKTSGRVLSPVDYGIFPP